MRRRSFPSSRRPSRHSLPSLRVDSQNCMWICILVLEVCYLYNTAHCCRMLFILPFCCGWGYSMTPSIFVFPVVLIWYPSSYPMLPSSLFPYPHMTFFHISNIYYVSSSQYPTLFTWTIEIQNVFSVSFQCLGPWAFERTVPRLKVPCTARRVVALCWLPTTGRFTLDRRQWIQCHGVCPNTVLFPQQA